jgi:hypothetical protein
VADTRAIDNRERPFRGVTHERDDTDALDALNAVNAVNAVNAQLHA